MHVQAVARQEARDAMAAVSDNAAGHSAAALHKDVAALRTKCEEQLHQQHFLRQSCAAPGPDRYCWVSLPWHTPLHAVTTHP
jgi:hypothetical protein